MISIIIKDQLKTNNDYANAICYVNMQIKKDWQVSNKV